MCWKRWIPRRRYSNSAAVNHVDHIVIGARRSSLVRKLLGSVSARVAAEATCTVTVVRPPRLAALQELEGTSKEPDEGSDELRGRA